MKLDWKWQDRDRLYHDQYEWSLMFRFEGVWTTRELNHAHVDRRTHPASFFNRGVPHDLHSWIDFVRSRTEAHKRVISYNWISVYTSSDALIQHILDLDYVWQGMRLHRARVTRPRDVILVQSPQHQYRSFFREKSVTRHNAKSLQQYLASNSHIQASQGLVRSMEILDNEPTRHSWWSRRYHYVDHDDTRDLTMLQLIVPNLVRCTMPIQAK